MSSEELNKPRLQRERSSRVALKRILSTQTLDTVDSNEDVQKDLRALSFEMIRLQEYVESLASKSGIVEEFSEGPTGKKFLKKTSKVVSSLVDKTLHDSFGWKGALAIAGLVILLHFVFIAVYTRVAMTTGCQTHVQMIDSKMWQAARSKDGHTRHICSMEMLSMRSEMFTKEGLEMLESFNLPWDTECHLNQIDHALVKHQSHRYEGFPTLLAHDFAKADWYPCMFEGMTCDDIASMDLCGPMDLLTEACKKGWITDANSKYKNPNAPTREEIGPYQCDATPKAQNASQTLEYKFSHFGKCNGLVSTVFTDCPDVGTTLGAAEGLAALISFLVWLVIVSPVAIYWNYKKNGGSNAEVMAAGMVDL